MSSPILRAIPRPRETLHLCLRFAPPIRPISTTAKHRISDPTTNVAAAVSQGKSPTPAPASIPSRRPSEPADDANPALFPSADELPPTNNKAGEQVPEQALHATSSKPSQVPQKTQAERIKEILEPNLIAMRKRDKRLKAEADARGETAHLKQVERQQKRIWREGDVYAPHDLSPAEQIKAYRARMTRGSPQSDQSAINTQKHGWRDIIDELGIDPLKEYKNPAMMGEFISVLGRIRHRKETGLRGVNQRKMAKAVRRSVALGMLPSTYRHPEMHPLQAVRRGKVSGSAVKFDDR